MATKQPGSGIPDVRDLTQYDISAQPTALGVFGTVAYVLTLLKAHAEDEECQQKHSQHEPLLRVIPAATATPCRGCRGSCAPSSCSDHCWAYTGRPPPFEAFIEFIFHLGKVAEVLCAESVRAPAP